MRQLIGVLICALLACGAARAGEPWQSLPPTPELPAASASGYVPVKGTRLFYARYGHGPTVLLLHGGLGNSSYWGLVVPKLVERGFEVIVADSPGHGRSERPRTPLHYRSMADAVLGLLDGLKVSRVDLVGWSDGGIIGLDLAMRHPERLRSVVAYGANSDPSGTRDGFDQVPTFAAYLSRTRDEYRRLSPAPGEYDLFMAQIQAMWEREPNYTAAQLGAIRVRTLICDGGHDEAIRREHSEYLARSIPGAQLRILEDVSHFGMLQNPNEFAAMVADFLQAPRGGVR